MARSTPPSPLPPALAAPLAELALHQLSQAGFGDADATGQTEVAIVAEALGVPAGLLLLTDGRQRTLQIAAAAGWTPPTSEIAVEGVLADALSQEGCHALRPVPPVLASAGVRGGLATRIGTAARPVGLLVALPSEPASFSSEARQFLGSAAAALRARFALGETHRQLEESRARALAVLDTTVDGVITIDTEGQIESFNAAAEAIFGYGADEVIGYNVRMLMPEPYRSEHDGYVESYRRTGLRHIIGIGREVVGRRKSGATFPMDLAVSEVALPAGGRIFTGLVRDISERRTLEREVLRVAEAERRRIGQDLHDGLGQELTAVGLFLRNHARQLPAGSAQSDEARRIVGLVDEADAHARLLARSLVPVEVERNGLEAALGHLASRASRLYGSDVTAEAFGEGPAEASSLLSDAATNLYWIAQEAVSNAVQHGRAGTIRILLVHGADRLRLRIEDDGSGVATTLHAGGTLGDPSASDRDPLATASGDEPESGASSPSADPRGMGLRIMHHRAHLAGGSLEIRPGAEGGTVVTCTIPFRGPGFQPSDRG
ncbi:MAG: PAS domain S-box protein [Bacteroidota bacterium]